MRHLFALFLLLVTNAVAQTWETVPLPSGVFSQGDGFSEGNSWERPVRTVTLGAFSIGKYECTNATVATLLQHAHNQGLLTITATEVYLLGDDKVLIEINSANRGVVFSNNNFAAATGKGSHPAGYVGWYGALALCNFASEIDGYQPVYNLTNWTWDRTKNGWRLPTEAEWEYAARGGLVGKRFPNGDTASHSEYNYQSKDSLPYDASLNAGFHPTWASTKTAPVGTFPANGFGLHEMAGNMYEAVWDRYTGYTSTAVVNPTGNDAGTLAIIRGGSYLTSASSCRNANRYRGTGPTYIIGDSGFRVARGALSAPSVYYVRKNGNNNNPGTDSLPWATIGKAAATVTAGNTVIIGNGDYDEHVQVDVSGSSGSKITFRAETQHGATLRAFRISGAYQVLDGLHFTRYSGTGGNLWAASVRIENDGDNSSVLNCKFSEYPQVRAHDFSFNAATSTVSSPSSDFIGAGFRVGSVIYLGSAGVEYGGNPLYFTNHDTFWTVAALDATNMTITRSNGVPMAADAGTGYWAYIRAAQATQHGNSAILGLRASGNAADAITVRGCTIDGWAATGIEWVGDDWLVENNTLKNGSAGFRGISWNGSRAVIRRNIMKDYSQPLYYSAADFSTIVHPEGTGWYDYITQAITSYGVTTVPQENNLIEENWFENIESPIGRVDDEVDEAFGIVFRRNVFIGLSGAMAGGRDDMEWVDNTFYRCGYLGTSPLTLGGRPPQQGGYVISGNLFVACGDRGATTNNGWYGLTSNAVTPFTDENFVCNDEVTGYASKTGFSETNGINGGNPIFYDVLDPDGADDTPFTADDGLKVLANSPTVSLGTSGGGALGVRPVTSGQPVAHFRITNPVGWFEATDESYNPTWDDVPPTQRTSLNRPWNVAVTVGTAPVAVTFSGAQSISGVGGAATNTAITSYSWNFGGGATATGQTPTHTFTTGGTKTVTLTVTNSAGNTHTTSRVYRVLGDEGGGEPTLGQPGQVQNVRVVVN